MTDFVWDVKRDYITQLAKENKRTDGRCFDEYRKIEVIPGYIPNACGSALVKMGNTQVLAGVSLDLGAPYPDSPDTGVIITNAELVPMASADFESGPPRPESIEFARVVDRGIRESKAIELNKLKLGTQKSQKAAMVNGDVAGEVEFDKLLVTNDDRVWMVLIDLHVLDYDGNLFDAGELAATTALWNTKLPKYEDGKLIRTEHAGRLPIVKKPIETTFVKIGNSVMIDPILDEEKVADARLTIATVESGICAAQKGLTGSFTPSEIDYCVETAFRKADELRKLVKHD